MVSRHGTVVRIRNNVLYTGPLGSRDGRTCNLKKAPGGWGRGGAWSSFPPLTFIMWQKMSLGGFGSMNVKQLPGHMIWGSPDWGISQISPDKGLRFGGWAFGQSF